MVYNAYVVVPLATWAVAQVAKFIIAAVRGDLNFRYLYASGGMPSVHSAVVASLATTAFILAGGGSFEFGVALILAAIVIYDSLGMRRAVGEQAMALNMVISSLNNGKVWVKNPDTRLREVSGHRPIEVVVGSLLGVLLAGLFGYQKLGYVGDFLQATPQKTEVYVYAAVFGVLLLGGLVQKFVLRRVYRKSRSVKQLANRVLLASVSVGAIGGVLAALEFEKASYAGWRVWMLTLLVLAALWAYSLFGFARREVIEGFHREKVEAHKRRWLPGGKKGGKKR